MPPKNAKELSSRSNATSAVLPPTATTIRLDGQDAPVPRPAPSVQDPRRRLKRPAFLLYIFHTVPKCAVPVLVLVITAKPQCDLYKHIDSYEVPDRKSESRTISA